MTEVQNPFEYEAATKLSVDKIASYYIDDFNYSRFINSTRNVVLVGDRGSGKTMALKFNSLAVQYHKTNAIPERIGIYIPCKTVLMKKKEQELLDDPSYASILAENFLTMSVLYQLVKDLSAIPDLTDGCDADSIKQECEYSLGFTLPDASSLLDSLRLAINKETREVQEALNSHLPEQEFPSTRSFGTSVLPLLETLRRIPNLKNSHFLIMLDDVHDLSDAQLRAVNSWIAYRDNTLFSIKIATARSDQQHFKTSSGGTVLDGHDFEQIDLETDYQNERSNFSKLATRVIAKRLSEVGIDTNPEEFFPPDAKVKEEMDKCRETVRKRAEGLFPNGTPKKISDYVYKFSRAEWFRDRRPNANLPAYAGLQILVYLSTGVVRNLLEPCYKMYDDALSKAEGAKVERIEPNLQSEKIKDRSENVWGRLKKLERFVEGCSKEDAEKIHNLFEQLAVLFRKRLEKHESEPRANSFTISAMADEQRETLVRLLEIAQQAQLLYVRRGPGKERGKRENYYIPNRMLWPIRGLDPHGQHARVSIRAEHLINATTGIAIPMHAKDSKSVKSDGQGELFDE